MIRRFYKCTFLSDVILNAQTATEGLSQSLDYIPGANFLGIVARDYSYFEEKGVAYEIFHSGNIRFCDAHVVIDGKRSLRKPLSWFYNKNQSYKEAIYVHHFLTCENRKRLDQLKQIRSGYFIVAENAIREASIERRYALKSAYDLSKRRSKESQMYGYDMILSGSEWIFHIDYETDRYIEEIEKNLTGNKMLGRSKTAQFGCVCIEVMSLSMEDMIFRNNMHHNQLVLYFESSAVFMDAWGMPGYSLTLQDLKLDNGYINWEKSQIRTRSYAPWNSKRSNRDGNRVCIDKGSVVIVSGLPDTFDLDHYHDQLKSGIGWHRNEGFGQILVNPDFLLNVDVNSAQLMFQVQEKSDELSLEDKIRHLYPDIKNDDSLPVLKSNFRNVSGEKKHCKVINRKVLDIMDQNPFRGISSSQWGAIRAIAMTTVSYTKLISALFDTKNGFLMHGKSEQDWKTNHKRDRLLEYLEEIKNKTNEDMARRFLISLCTNINRG